VNRKPGLAQSFHDHQIGSTRTSPRDLTEAMALKPLLPRAFRVRDFDDSAFARANP
jgi:hypothetical protein